MSNTTTPTGTWDPKKFPRYTLFPGEGRLYDNKFKRDLSAQARRGSPPYFRVVDEGGEAFHIPALSLFDDDIADDLVDITSDFEPQDFNDRYTFNIEAGTVTKRTSGKSPKLQTSNDWNRYFLTRNCGKRVSVSPTEIRNLFTREEWRVSPPIGSRVFKIFPNHAFTKEGKVFKVISKDPIHEPRPLIPISLPNGEYLYKIKSSTGQEHRFTRTAIKAVFTQ
jgi:hypothetical protein|tara:strand:- start:3472 stop:4137 length:666 start_codon:yes stop_codon:yes gene_type:complete